MKRKSSSLVLVLSIALLGCGSGGGYNSGGNNGGGNGYNSTMQTGQWEFAFTPTSSQPINLEANVVATTTMVSADTNNTLLFQNGGLVVGLFFECSNFYLNGVVSNGSLSGTLATNNTPFVTISNATISSNGQSVSGGSFSETGNFCGPLPTNVTGSFAGYAVTPLNGTFTGTITSTGHQDQITLQITQDSNFGITSSGSSVASGVTTSLSSTSTGSNVIGATVKINGTATNVNGSSTFLLAGHFNQAGTQILVGITGGTSWLSGTETGTLTKQ